MVQLQVHQPLVFLVQMRAFSLLLSLCLFAFVFFASLERGKTVILLISNVNYLKPYFVKLFLKLIVIKGHGQKA